MNDKDIVLERCKSYYEKNKQKKIKEYAYDYNKTYYLE
jgi:hypothetical protein